MNLYTILISDFIDCQIFDWDVYKETHIKLSDYIIEYLNDYGYYHIPNTKSFIVDIQHNFDFVGDLIYPPIYPRIHSTVLCKMVNNLKYLIRKEKLDIILN